MSCARCKKKIIVTLQCTNCSFEQKIQVREGNNPLVIAERRQTTCNNCQGKGFIIL